MKYESLETNKASNVQRDNGTELQQLFLNVYEKMHVPQAAGTAFRTTLGLALKRLWSQMLEERNAAHFSRARRILITLKITFYSKRLRSCSNSVKTPQEKVALTQCKKDMLKSVSSLL